MIKLTSTVLFFLFCISGALAAPVAPSVSSGIEPGVVFRIFNNHDSFSLMAEGTAENETDARNFKEVTLGGYYQVLDHLKLGAFVREAYGLRHDDDWFSNNGSWQWANTDARGESFVILDVTPRTLLTDEWLAEIKMRYLYDLFNNEKTLLMRPGMTYFLLDGGQPYWNFFAQVEMDFPLNYSAAKVNEEWIYVGALNRIAKDLDVGGFVAEKWQAWTSSQDYLAKAGAPYTNTAQSTVISAILVYQFE
jgi:hypothetical protein